MPSLFVLPHLVHKSHQHIADFMAHIITIVHPERGVDVAQLLDVLAEHLVYQLLATVGDDVVDESIYGSI